VEARLESRRGTHLCFNCFKGGAELVYLILVRSCLESEPHLRRVDHRVPGVRVSHRKKIKIKEIVVVRKRTLQKLIISSRKKLRSVN
jgi:hypothetical protein